MNTIGTQENVHEQLVALVPRLRRFARNLVRNQDDADDVVQIALERALKNWSQWRTDARLDGWLFKIVRNAWIDEVRSRKRRNQVFVAEEAGEEVGSNIMEQASNAMSVQSAMARLPEDQRTAVSLVLVEGLPYKEAADVLDIPIGTLTSRLARARAALQTLLEAEGERR
jgi:RNA polymerase sigma-70 factor (ECF subfamily)